MADYQMDVLSRQNIWEFVTAGDAKFTIVSRPTGTRFTYKVKESNSGEVFFVALLTGDNDKWTYMGIIPIHEGCIDEFRTTAKSRISVNEKSLRTFEWFFDRLLAHRDLTDIEFWHAGRCGRCARELTVPESIARGIGPICAKTMGVTH